MSVIDLRSDTVTQPSPAMREAIAQADLGDDVYGEDPTVNRLQDMAARLMGKEAALLVPSGTMGNLAALLAHCQRGTRVLVGDQNHIFVYEAGGASALGGIMYHTLPVQPDGTIDLSTIKRTLAYEDDDPHIAPIGLLCMENTHNRCGGAVLTPDYMARVHTLVRQHDILLHLDGARILSAAVALGVDVRTLTRHADTVQFCLSKNLAAPVGSIIAGSSAFIEQAHRVRKMLGGGMRQAGIIAAAGIVALSEMIERLAEDHANARLFAEGVASLPGINLDPASVQTNIIIFTLDDAYIPSSFLESLEGQGVLLISMGGQRLRAVTHYGITADDIHRAVEAVKQGLKR